MTATWDFYRDIYLGDRLTEETFPRYATRADAYLDACTMGRYQLTCLPEPVREAVRMAECAIADQCLLLDQATLSDPALESEKVGNYSRTYRSSADLSRDTEKQLRNLAARYLGRYGLLSTAIPVPT